MCKSLINNVANLNLVCEDEHLAKNGCDNGYTEEDKNEVCSIVLMNWPRV